jgi:hypothetical protein
MKETGSSEARNGILLVWSGEVNHVGSEVL